MSPLPEYFKRPIYRGKNLSRVEETLQNLDLKTVCQEALCPNQGECWSQGTATFLILGKYCTRNCRFCAVESGAPPLPDSEEPKRIAEAVGKLGLKYAVITSVTRDDLPDGGASHWAKVIQEIRRKNPQIKVEVLIPDFLGSLEPLKTVMDARPDVLAHNLETVPRLYQTVRPKADYKRSLKLLETAKILNPKIPIKSGLMLGLGETGKEVLGTLMDLRRVECDFLTLGQYLAPSEKHLQVQRFASLKEFEAWKTIALKMVFKNVASGPLVRSSYRAHESIS